MITAIENSQTVGEYQYNGNGQRVKKTNSSGTMVFHYDLKGSIMAESTTTGTMTAEYVFLNSRPFAKIEGSSVYYYHNDHLGTPQKMTNQSQGIVWEGSFLPFGEDLSITGTITNNLGFPGQYYDAETGLYYNYFRDYNPEIGRYVEADPIGIQRGKNHLFGYVQGNPVVFSDYRGLKVELCSAPVDVPLVPYFIEHAWLKTSSKEAGMGLAPDCGDLVGNPFGKPTQICPHSSRAGNCAELNCVDEACVNNELIMHKQLGPWGPLNNCWSFVGEVINKCKKKGGCCRESTR